MSDEPTVSIVVYGAAAPAGSKTTGVTKDGRRFVRDSSKGSYAWKDRVAGEAGKIMDGREILEGPLWLNALFVVARPKSHYGRRGLLPSAPSHPTVRPDATKLLRAVEDAMKGIVYRDDAQVVRQVAFKDYGHPERVEIQVWSL